MPNAPSQVTDSPQLLAGESEQQASRSMLQRAARALLLTSIVALSFLSYPSVVPWMIAFWLVWHTFARTRGKPGTMQLLACIAILLAKRVYLAPSLVAFIGLAFVVAVWCALGSGKRETRSYLRWLAPLSLWCSWGVVALEWQAIARCNHPVGMDPARPVVCIGDSITSGLLPDRGYPEELKKLLHLPVVNLGQSGMTTRGGLKRLPRIAAAKPQIVVIELGGIDFLQGKSRAGTKENLEQLITACRDMGAEVVLVEIARGFMTDPFAGLEREIARAYDLELVADSAIRQFVIWSPVSPPGKWMPQSHLSDDGIHTNAQGNKFLARNVADALERMVGARIRPDR